MLMPYMDGLDFTLAVRALEAGRGEQPPLPIVLISSGGYRSGDPRAKVAGLAAARRAAPSPLTLC
jgi:CheY-like chemotaxis protein